MDRSIHKPTRLPVTPSQFVCIFSSPSVTDWDADATICQQSLPLFEELLPLDPDCDASAEILIGQPGIKLSYWFLAVFQSVFGYFSSSEVPEKYF